MLDVKWQHDLIYIGSQATLNGAEGLVAKECVGVLSTSRRSLSGRSGVVGADWKLALTCADVSPAERGRSVRGTMFSLMRSPSPIGVSPTVTAGLEDLYHRQKALQLYSLQDNRHQTLSILKLDMAS